MPKKVLIHMNSAFNHCMTQTDYWVLREWKERTERQKEKIRIYLIWFQQEYFLKCGLGQQG
jgi:hypothetical protein